MRARFVTALCFAAVAGATAFVVVSSRSSSREQSARQALDAAPVRTRETPQHLWQSTCGYCHGGPMNAPELRGMQLPEEAIIYYVRNGAPGMPPFHDSAISDQDLVALARWIAKQPAPEKPQ